GPVGAILDERGVAGKYESVFDLLTRLEQGAINKKVLESLALGGAFDCFDELHRAQFFAPSDKYDSFIEHLVRFASAYQSQKLSVANSLFGDMQEEITVQAPEPPECREWSLVEKLDKEKSVTGIFISGHPLDDYRMEIENFVTCSLVDIDNHQARNTINVAGSITAARHMISKNGNGWGIFSMSDYDGNLEFKLFGEDYQKFKHLLEPGMALFIKGGFQKSWRDESLQFKVKEIRLLESIGENMTEGITIKLPLENITAELVEQLDDLCQRRKGQHKLRMVLLERRHRMRLALAAKERRVQADNDFIAELDRLGVEYKVETAAKATA
ncbi:MAG: DNA polymerase III subunit alpha, partial [Lewinella sp.]|nr:DNA polymerase III subunit alpha [Lewinella sp.]